MWNHLTWEIPSSHLPVGLLIMGPTESKEIACEIRHDIRKSALIGLVAGEDGMGKIFKKKMNTNQLSGL